jgi:phosphatidate cytidylyltransferase
MEPQSSEPATTGGRRRPAAGRNLPMAVGSGLVLGLLVLVTDYLWPPVFVGVVVVAILIAVWELVHAVAARGANPPQVPLGVGTVAVLIAAYVGGPDALAVAFVLTVLAIMLTRLTGPVEGAVVDLAAGVWIAGYVPLMAAFAVLMVAQPDGADRIVVFVLTTICSDIGGYLAGVLFGRHPMAPTISPKKTWEGFAGSVLLCVVAGSVSAHVLLGAAWWQGMLVGLAVVVTATLGDLAESMLKRDLGIKDMGRLIPGHGGMMDRLDSLAPTAPVVYLLLTVFVGG